MASHAPFFQSLQCPRLQANTTSVTPKKLKSDSTETHTNGLRIEGFTDLQCDGFARPSLQKLAESAASDIKRCRLPQSNTKEAATKSMQTVCGFKGSRKLNAIPSHAPFSQSLQCPRLQANTTRIPPKLKRGSTRGDKSPPLASLQACGIGSARLHLHHMPPGATSFLDDLPPVVPNSGSTRYRQGLETKQSPNKQSFRRAVRPSMSLKTL